MTGTSIENRLRAFHNVAAEIDAEVNLPEMVLRGTWSSFLFFESDQVFARSFFKIIQEVMTIERSVSCCLLNLTRTRPIEFQSASAIFFEDIATDNEYFEILKSKDSGTAWLFLMDRYGCATEVGSWCIYCERENDIAVMGLRYADAAKVYASPLKRLRAMSIESIVQHDSDVVYPLSDLKPQWQKRLMSNYYAGPKRKA